MQLKCGAWVGAWIEKAGPRVETEQRSTLCLISPAEVQFKCRRTGAKAAVCECDDGACVCVLSQRGRGAKYCDSLARPKEEEEEKIYVLSYFLPPSFRIWNRKRLSDSWFTQKPWLLYLSKEGEQNIVTV